jgi:membrane-associated phospholipid phosphatase
MWAGTYVSLAILIPLLYLVCLVQQGIVTDLDVQLREQRMRPLIFTMVFNGLAWGVLVLGAAPAQLVLLAGALWVQTVVIFVITLRWKISVHCAAAASLGTLVWSLIGTPWPLLIGVPIVAWSRVRLRRHTPAQTVAGALLGIAIFAAALWLVNGG